MIRWIRVSSCLSVIAALLAIVVVPGCNKIKDGVKDKDKTTVKEKTEVKEEHPTAGPHGGPLAEWGDDDFHAEFTVDHAAKEVTVYILDGHAKHAPKIAHDKITKVKVTFKGVAFKDAGSVDLKHDMKKSSDKGIAFVGTDDRFGKQEKMELDISGHVEDKRYNGAVTYTPKSDNKEKAELSLTPGGIYTAADIKKNGNITPKEKFKGVKHAGGEAKEGDKICPISGEKSNPECFWVVQDQRYEFCCPPCVNSFLKLAHEEPTKVKNAKEYVFKSK